MTLPSLRRNCSFRSSFLSYMLRALTTGEYSQSSSSLSRCESNPGPCSDSNSTTFRNEPS